MSVPQSLRTATVNIFGVELVVHHLDNGQRVIEEASMIAFVEALGSGLPTGPDDAEGLEAALHAIFGEGQVA